MERNILITGASSGLGLALLQHYASLASTTLIIALNMAPLPSFVSSSTICFHQLDITSEPSLVSLATQLKDTRIQLLIHSAGIRGLVPSIAEEKRDVAAAETYEVMDQVTFMKTLEINTWGTFHVIKSFLSNLRLAATSLPTMQPPKVAIMTSRMGSLAANTAGGGYAYRASKAAVNALVKSFSVDVREVVFLLLHPGRVETGLVGWKEEGAMSVEESLSTCLDVIEKARSEDSGAFVDRFGEVIKW